MVLDYVGIVYAVVLLIFLLTGLKKGLFKTLVSLIESILSFVASIFFCKPVAALILKFNFTTNLQTNLIGKFAAKGLDVAYSEEGFNSVYSSLKLPEAVRPLLSKIILSLFPAAEETMTLAEVLGKSIVYYSCIVIAWILLFIIIRILCILLNKLFSYFVKIPVIGFINKIGGALIGLATGIMIVLLISYGLTFIIPLENQVSEWLVGKMYLNTDNVFTISGYLYQHNFLLKIITYFQKLLIK